MLENKQHDFLFSSWLVLLMTLYLIIFGGILHPFTSFRLLCKDLLQSFNFAIQAALLNTFGDLEILQKFKHLRISIDFKKSPLWIMFLNPIREWVHSSLTLICAAQSWSLIEVQQNIYMDIRTLLQGIILLFFVYKHKETA